MRALGVLFAIELSLMPRADPTAAGPGMDRTAEGSAWESCERTGREGNKGQLVSQCQPMYNLTIRADTGQIRRSSRSHAGHC